MPQYEVLEILGRGGMGVVYKAKDTILNRIVAIKVFHENLVQQEVVIKRFLRESTISAQLDHSNIVKVYSFERQGGQSFLVMECIHGKPLLDYMEEKQPDLEAKLAILAKVANALHYAHRKNIVHRDIKPSNIMVRSNGEPVVMDFGIAKCIGLDELTRTGEFVGTIQYVSPEQAEGKRRELDHRTDVYSLGAVMYHLLVGKPPVEAATFNEMLYQLAYQSPTQPRKIHPEIAPAVEQICLKALAKNKTQRYSSAQEFADDIQNYLAGKKTKAVSWAKQQIWKRWLLRSSLVVGIIFVLLSVAMGSYWYSQQQKIAEKQAVFMQKIQVLQTQVEKKEPWSIDNPGPWEQAYQHGKDAYNLYQQNRQWLNYPEWETRLPNDLAECAYKIGIHQWVEDPLESIPSFSAVLSTSLEKEQQAVKVQIAMLAADMHLKYLSRNYHQVCNSFVEFQALFQDQKYIRGYYPEVLFLVAKSHYHCQQYEDTQKYLQELMQHSNFISHPKLKTEGLYYQGMCYYHKNQYQNALEKFKNADQTLHAYPKSVDFEVSLLIHWGDCQSQLLPYYQPLTYQQQDQLQQILKRLDKVEDKLSPRSGELALYYELSARSLLWQIDGQDPTPEKVEQALALIGKSDRILPCRYTQHLLRGIAFRYQGRTNFAQYHKAWQAFYNAYQLNPHQTNSTTFIIELTSEYLNFSRDQVFDLIVQLEQWNTSMDNIATDLYATRMHQLELQCQAQLQKFVGIPYQNQRVEKFYSDLQSPIASIRLLARSSLVDLVSDQDGMADHQHTISYLNEKLKQLTDDHSLRTTLEEILADIDAQASKEAAWQHLYLLVRIPYRGRIPDIVIEECHQRPGFITFLMQIILQQERPIMPEWQTSWHWIQYLAMRVLAQLPYPLSEGSLSQLPGIDKSQNVYARQILYTMITSPSPAAQSLSPLFCLSAAKALQDTRFLWWNRKLICGWFEKIWPQLKDNQAPEDMWLQTNIVSLLMSETDDNASKLLAIIYKETKYNLVKFFLIHELPKYESHFLPDLIITDWYNWAEQQEMQQRKGPTEANPLLILNIMNTKVVCRYLVQKYQAVTIQHTKQERQEKIEAYRKVIIFLSNLLQKNMDNIIIQKAVICTMIISWDINRILNMTNNTDTFFAHTLSNMLNSPDQEARLLAIAATPIIGNEFSWQELKNRALDSKQAFIEKLALFYGLSNGMTKNIGLKGYEQKIQPLFAILFQIQEARVQGWLFAIFCHFRYYMVDKILDNQMKFGFISQIDGNMMKYLSSSSPDLLFWTLLSITKTDEFSQYVYNKLSNMVNESQFPTPMLEILGLGILINISIKHNLTKDYQKWKNLGYEKLKNPRFRPYLSILVWSYLQAMRNNEINFQLHAEILGHEEEVAIQDFYWLRYQKNLLDPKLRHYAEISLQGAIQLFAQFADNLNQLEQKHWQQVELMLAELYYRDGNLAQGNQILENNNKHREQISAAMLWLERNPQRIHEIWPAWNEKNQPNTKNNTLVTIHDTAMLMRMKAIQYAQEKNIEMEIQALQEAALLEPGEAKSWVLLSDAMQKADRYEAAIKVIFEAHRCGFYQARTFWAWIQHCAKYQPQDQKHTAILYLLESAGAPWEYPITFQMLKDLGCNGIPSGEICYRLAINHAKNRWHYEACYWLKEAAKLNYKLTPQQLQDDFYFFQKYKTKKYQVYDAQAAIKELFESK